MTKNTLHLSQAAENLHTPSNGRLTHISSGAIDANLKKAVFLDRDGVLNQEVGYIHSPNQLKLLPGVAGALIYLQERFYLIVVTNQSGIGRGLFSENDLFSVHNELIQLLATEGALLDGLFYCPHIPGAAIERFSIVCDCRKPSSGMLLAAESSYGIDLSESFIVGDKITDIQCGAAVGVKGILVGADAVNHSDATVAKDLTAASILIAHSDTNMPGTRRNHSTNRSDSTSESAE